MLTSLAQQDSIVISISPRVSIHHLANIRLLPEAHIETTIFFNRLLSMLASLAEKNSAQCANISVPNIVSLQRLIQQD